MFRYEQTNGRNSSCNIRLCDCDTSYKLPDRSSFIAGRGGKWPFKLSVLVHLVCNIDQSGSSSYFVLVYDCSKTRGGGIGV